MIFMHEILTCQGELNSARDFIFLSFEIMAL